MRLLVRCQSCNRQFDASGQRDGSAFRCHCGARLVVPSPRGHLARVVRCEACGGPVQDGLDRCAHCGATLTLHERDLDTVCPACFARVSDAARFCHLCGTRLEAEPAVTTRSEHPCPVCGEAHKLQHRAFPSGAALLECRRCAGLFVSHATLSQLVEASQKATPPVTAPRPQPVGPQTGPMYRRCPLCQTFMHRKNFGERSGVIVDICARDGVWFDASELESLLAWVRAGGRATLPPRHEHAPLELPAPPARDPTLWDTVEHLLAELGIAIVRR